MARNNRYGLGNNKSGEFVTANPGGRKPSKGFKRGGREEGRGPRKFSDHRLSQNRGANRRYQSAANNLAGGKMFNKKDIRAMRGMGMTQQQIQDEASKINPRYMGAKGQVALGNYETPDSLEDYDVDTITSRQQYAQNQGLDNAKTQFEPGSNADADLQRPEVRKLIKDFGARKVNNWVKENNLTMGSKAQRRLNSKLAEIKGNDTVTDVTMPTDGKGGKTGGEGGAIDTNPATNPATAANSTAIDARGQEMTQIQSVGSDKMNDNEFNNTLSVAGDNFGNNYLGQIDNSINIASQRGEQNMGKPTDGGRGMDALGRGDSGYEGGLTAETLTGNIGAGETYAKAAATTGFLENLYNRQQTAFSPIGTAAKFARGGDALTNMEARNQNLDYLTRLDPMNMRAKAMGYERRTMGDLDSMPPIEWQDADKPEKVKPFDKTVDDLVPNL